jgi:hypothetical protein
MQNSRYRVARWATSLTAAAIMLGVAGQAHAAPLLVNPGQLTADGPVTAVFAFVEANDVSHLLEASFAGVIFNNQTDAVGTTRTLANAAGPITFQLSNTTQGYSFFTGIADTVLINGNEVYYAKYSANFADFGVGALPGAAAAAIAGLSGPVLYVGFEDRRGGDYDYNDLIFAFSSVRVQIPEPTSLVLFGVGLLGVSATRRLRRKK